MNERQSNIELLRIVSMILVVFVHANYFSLGYVTNNDCVNSPFTACVRILFEQICIICVNLFVLISGWFGIKPTIKGFCSLVFQYLFYNVLFWGISRIMGEDSIGFYLLGYNYWFVIAYMLLYILAPILNSFIKHNEIGCVASVLLSYFLYETIYGWKTGFAPFVDGYSTLSFIGLYLIARFLGNNVSVIRRTSPTTDLFIYGIFTLIPSAIAFCGLLKKNNDYGAISYCSPFVIIASLSFFLFFTKISINSSFINRVAKSIFAVYLIHAHPLGQRYFKHIMSIVYNDASGLCYVFFVLLFTVFLCSVCVLIDQVRLFIWNVISPYINVIDTKVRNCITVYMVDKLYNHKNESQDIRHNSLP